MTSRRRGREIVAAPAVGLVLGGGGARGLGHIVVLEAFDELGIRPAAIAGASIGAILGAVYAGGMPAVAMRAATLDAFRDGGAALARLWHLRPRKLADVFSGRIGPIDPERVLEAFVGPFLRETFEELTIPFAAVATDFYGARPVTFRSGALKPAVAASMALPSLFRPVMRDGMVLVDGGITDPVPVGALPPVDLRVAVDVVALPEPREAGMPSALEAIVGATHLLMATLAETKFLLAPPDLLIRPPVGRFHVLDFLKAREILEACDADKDDVKRRLARLIESPTLATS